MPFGGLHWHHGDHKDCPGPGKLKLTGLDRRQAKGAYFTPRFMAENLTLNTLDAQVYDPGPLQTGDRSAWRPAAGAMGCEGDALTDA